MKRFRLQIGKHYTETGKKLIKGDIINTDLDLVKLFPNKFLFLEEIEDVVEKPIQADTPIVKPAPIQITPIPKKLVVKPVPVKRARKLHAVKTKLGYNVINPKKGTKINNAPLKQSEAENLTDE